VPEKGRAQYVVPCRLTSATEDATGVVHTWRSYGVDDLKLCLSFGIPFAHTVDLTGHFFPYVEKFAGIGVKDGTLSSSTT